MFNLLRIVWYADGELKQDPVSEIDNHHAISIEHTSADGNSMKIGEHCVPHVWQVEWY